MPSDIKMETAANLRALLAEYKLYPSELARDMEVAASTVTKWLQGKALPGAVAIDRMINRYGWTKEQLLLGKRGPSTPIEDILKEHNNSESPFVIELRKRAKSPVKKQ